MLMAKRKSWETKVSKQTRLTEEPWQPVNCITTKIQMTKIFKNKPFDSWHITKTFLPSDIYEHCYKNNAKNLLWLTTEGSNTTVIYHRATVNYCPSKIISVL
jgi:hypothetical protein